MATSCVEWLNWKDLRSILENPTPELDQGKVGEVAAHLVAQELLGLSETAFSPATHGFDNVMRDKHGNLVIVEIKTTHGNPLDRLDPTKHGKQMEKEWTEWVAGRMSDTNTEFYGDNPNNDKIGREILAKGSDNVRHVLIHVDPITHGIDHYEWLNNQWQRVMSYSGKDMEERLKPHGH